MEITKRLKLYGKKKLSEIKRSTVFAAKKVAPLKVKLASKALKGAYRAGKFVGRLKGRKQNV